MESKAGFMVQLYQLQGSEWVSSLLNLDFPIVKTEIELDGSTSEEQQSRQLKGECAPHGRLCALSSQCTRIPLLALPLSSTHW